MRLWREEVFGPVLAAMTFKTEEEAVQLANASEFGLAGAVISADEQVCAPTTLPAWSCCKGASSPESDWGCLSLLLSTAECVTS